LLVQGTNLPDALALLFAGEAPTPDGAFLLSVLVAIAAYVAVGLLERRAPAAQAAE
jgi:hypothetical protein